MSNVKVSKEVLADIQKEVTNDFEQQKKDLIKEIVTQYKSKINDITYSIKRAEKDLKETEKNFEEYLASVTQD